MSATVLGVFTTLLTAAGLYFGHNLGRQARLTIVGRRFEAYSQLWAILEVSGPWRMETEDAKPNLTPSGIPRGAMSEPERLNLYDEMTRWYFSGGRGMLLGPITREIYLNAKYNMICDECKLRLKPKLSRCEIVRYLEKEGVSGEHWRSEISMKQLSLLRAAMRHDLRVLDAEIYQRGLSFLDKAFLREAGARLYKKPWRSAKGPIRRPF